MSHPTSEEWMEYLYGELAGEARSALAAHLQECGECQEQVESWRGVMTQLDAWQIPQGRRRAPAMRGLVRLAAAAVVLLGLGIVVGRLSAPSLDVASLRADLERSLRSSLGREIRGALREELRAEMKDMAVVTLVASRDAAEERLGEYARALDATRRSDLLALATLTEQELMRTQRQMATALAYAPAVTPVSTAGAGSDTSQ
ncbi:MAG: anti-sigma factor family protein [Planctomycetota bacterium]|jgi:hypothetical protein